MNDTPSVEQTLERIETLVAKMEAGDRPLDEVIAIFEEGIKLVHDCREKLSAAEKRIQIFVQGNTGARLVAGLSSP